MTEVDARNALIDAGYSLTDIVRVSGSFGDGWTDLDHLGESGGTGYKYADTHSANGTVSWQSAGPGLSGLTVDPNIIIAVDIWGVNGDEFGGEDLFVEFTLDEWTSDVAHTAFPTFAGPTGEGDTGFVVEITDLIRPDDTGYPVVRATLEQYKDLSVSIELNASREMRLTISMYDPLAPWMTHYEHAVRIWYRDMEVPVYWGPFTWEDDFSNGTITITAVDTIRLQHHFVRRGDAALNKTDPDDGTLQPDYTAYRLTRDAANNTSGQDDRNVPSLGIGNGTSSTEHPEVVLGMDIERGQQVFDIWNRVAESEIAPDWELAPQVNNRRFYCLLNCYDRQGEIISDTTVFAYNWPGEPNNVAAITAKPMTPTTHVHVVDGKAKYRVTEADADASLRMGIFVAWEPYDMKVKLDDSGEPILDGMQYVAKGIIAAYSNGPIEATVTLRPDEGQTMFYGVDYRVGDVIMLKAAKGAREMEGEYRIRKVELTQSGSRGLPTTNLTLVPSLPAGDPDEES